MKREAPQCELDDHQILISLAGCPLPYVTLRCVCQTCGAEWLETYERTFVGESKAGAKPVPLASQPSLDLLFSKP